MKRLAIAIVTIVLLVSTAALAWHDTHVRGQTAEPLIKAFPADVCEDADDLRNDAQANGGRGGKAAFLAPGKNIGFSAELKQPSVYSVWVTVQAPTWAEAEGMEQAFGSCGQTTRFAGIAKRSGLVCGRCPKPSISSRSTLGPSASGCLA